METILKDSLAVWGVAMVAALSVSIYIFNSSMNSIYDSTEQLEYTESQLSSQEIDVFNSQWTSYEGVQPGSSVKSLISKLISNANVNEYDDEKLPDLYYEPTEETATFGDTDLVVVSDTFDNGISDFNKARTQIETKHTYYVEIHFSEDTSLVDAIYVHYYEPNDENNEYDYELPTLILDSYVYNTDMTNTDIN